MDMLRNFFGIIVTNCRKRSLMIDREVKIVQDFDKIYSEYFAEVYKFVFSLCQNSVLAEEITQ